MSHDYGHKKFESEMFHIGEINEKFNERMRFFHLDQILIKIDQVGHFPLKDRCNISRLVEN